MDRASQSIKVEINIGAITRNIFPIKGALTIFDHGCGNGFI